MLLKGFIDFSHSKNLSDANGKKFINAITTITKINIQISVIINAWVVNAFLFILS